MAPNFDAMARLPDTRGVIVTARAAADAGADFVSRYFAPAIGVAEDPVTGSAHCVLAPHWRLRLGKVAAARALAPRLGPRCACALRGLRVLVARLVCVRAGAATQDRMLGFQASARGGAVEVELTAGGARVLLRGAAVVARRVELLSCPPSP